VSSDNPMVRFDKVQKSYDGKTLVVKNLDVDIAKGEFLTMLGPSGSGKTTSLMMLAGFEPATHGEIYLNGKPINNVPPNKRGIGMVFQNYALFPHMTVAENLAFPLRVRKMGDAEVKDKVKRILELVELPQFGDRRPAQLSGGQQQRYVTHDQSEALTMSDRIAVFEDGVIQQLSSPADLYERPNNSFVAQFIGENNRLSGTISEINADVCVVELDGGERVGAHKVVDGGVGTRTTLSIRPERIELDPLAGSVPVTIPGKIEELIYLGDHIRVRLSVAGTSEFIVKVRNRTGRRDLQAGQQTTVGWSPQDCRALDELGV